MTVLHDAPVVPSQPTTVVHPTACPSWCKDRRGRTDHHFGPTATWHWSPQYQLQHPRPLEGEPPMLRAELMRDDEGAEVGEVILFVQAEGDIDLRADEADMFITQLQGFVDTLRVLRQQMR